jgi:AcrR family transcriptional regulator
MRSDAEHNQARIVRAARDLVATRGPDVPMGEIAAAAGVAVGTLYRHYPTKADLMMAVVEHSTGEIAEIAQDSARSVAAGADALAELDVLVRRLAERHAVDRALKLACGRLGIPVPADPAALSDVPPGSAAARAAAAIESLVTAARAGGRARPDLTLADLIMLLGALPGGDGPAEYRRRYLDIMLAGIRATPS